MKKVIFFLILLLCVVFFLFTNRRCEEDFRIRVIANDNSKEAIELKMEVVDYLKKNYICDNKNLKSYFKDNVDIIKNDLESNFNININVSFKSYYFTQKAYNNIAIPDGYYEALIISIEEGAGDNWWCSIFNDRITYEDTDKIEYKWYLLERNGLCTK